MKKVVRFLIFVLTISLICTLLKPIQKVEAVKVLTEWDTITINVGTDGSTNYSANNLGSSFERTSLSGEIQWDGDE